MLKDILQNLEKLEEDVKNLILLETNILIKLEKLEAMLECFDRKDKQTLDLIKRRFITSHKFIKRNLGFLLTSLETYKTIKNPNNEMFLTILTAYFVDMNVDKKNIDLINDEFLLFMSGIDKQSNNIIQFEDISYEINSNIILMENFLNFYN